MTVFKYFLKNAARRKSIFIIYFAVLMIISLLNTMGAKNREEQSFSEYKPSIALIKEESSELADALEAYLKERGIPVEAPDTLEEGKEMIFLNRADAVVRIPAQVEQRLVNGKYCIEILYDNKSIQGHIVENQLYKYLLLLKATEKEESFDFTLVNRALEKKVEVIFREKDAEADGNRRNDFAFYFKFSAYMITAVLIGMIGLAMSDFQNNNVLQRIRSSSMKTLRLQILLYSGQLFITFLITGVVLLTGIALQKGRVSGPDLSRTILNLSVFSLAILSLTFMINSITGNKHVKSALSTVVSLGMGFLSGVMLPQEFLSDFTLNLSKCMPMYYYVRINDNPNIDSAELFLNLGIQLGFAVFFLGIGIMAAHLKRKKLV